MIEQARPAYHYAIDAMDAKMREARKSQQAEVSFAKIMLAYHRGAEAIAQTQLKYGQDEEMRALAQQIIDEQLTEIIALQSWLESQGIETYPRVLPLADSNAPLAETDALGVEGEKVKEAEPKSANIKETKAQIPEVRATEVKAAK